MRYVINLLIMFIAISCSQSSKVEFGVNQKYILDEQESIMPVTQDLIDEYNSYFSYDTLNFPVNKGIQSKNRKVLIGMAVDGNIEQVSNRIADDSLANIITQQQYQIHEVPVESYFFKKNNQYIHALLYDFQNERYSLGMMVSFLSKDSSSIATTMDNAYLEKKLMIGSH